MVNKLYVTWAASCKSCSYQREKTGAIDDKNGDAEMMIRFLMRRHAEKTGHLDFTLSKHHH